MLFRSSGFVILSSFVIRHSSFLSEGIITYYETTAETTATDFDIDRSVGDFSYPEQATNTTPAWG